MSGVASLWRPSIQSLRRSVCKKNSSVCRVELLGNGVAVETPSIPASASAIMANQQRHISSYVVLLPEVPPDSPETNPIMRLDGLPAFSEITPIDCVNGVAKLSIEFETELTLHGERLTQSANSFESVRLRKKNSLID